MKKAFAATILFLVTALLLGRHCFAQENTRYIAPFTRRTSVHSKEDRIIVFYEQAPTATKLLSISQEYRNISLQHGLSDAQATVYSVQKEQTDDTISRLKKDPNVRSVIKDFQFSLLNIPNDEKISSEPTEGEPQEQWSMFNANFAGAQESAWDKTTGSNEVVVAVIDSGIDSNHPDLQDKISSLVDCSGQSCQEVDTMTDNVNFSNGHGTHVAGLVGAKTNNTIGISSAGYNTKIMFLKVMDDDGTMLFSYLINALNWAVDHNAKVVNISLGVMEDNLTAEKITEIDNLMKNVWDKGTVIVAAAGNCGGDVGSRQGCEIYGENDEVIGYAQNSKTYPAASTNVLSVASLDYNNNIASYSQRNDVEHGDWILVSAPGGDCSTNLEKLYCIVSTHPDSSYGYLAGTSIASPHVTGLAGLLFAIDPSFTNSQVKQIMENSADSNIAPAMSKYGAINAYNAVLEALDEAVEPPDEADATSTPVPTQAPPTITPYPTTGPAKLPKTPPDPYPPAPFCPNLDSCANKKEGDANCDDNIDATDYTDFWLKQYDLMIPASPNNENSNFSCIEGDSSTYFVDLKDFEVWRRGRVKKDNK